MRRIAAIAIRMILVLSIAVPVASVGAQGPPTDVGNPFPDPIPGLCEDFPVRIDLRGKMKVIELPGGGFITTSPGLKATITNTESEQAVTLNITGPITETVLANGNVQRVMHGRNLFSDPSVGFVLLIGKFTAVTDASTNTLVQPLDEHGQVIDLCALLD